MSKLRGNFYKFSVYLYILFASSVLFSQEITDFKSLRTQILSEFAARDIDLAFAYTDSLQTLAKTKREEHQVEMVRAVLFHQLGDKNKALSIAMEVESNFEKNRNYTDQIGAIGFIASNFRELGLEGEALYYLNKAQHSIDMLSNHHLKGQYGALMQHENIGIYSSKQKYDKVAQSLEHAYAYIEEIEPGKQKDFFLATTIKLNAINAYHLENYSAAKQLYHKSLEVLGTKEDLLYGEVQLGLAKIALKENQYNRSLDYLTEVDSLTNASQYFQLKKELYKTYMNYYEAIGDTTKYDKTHYLYLQTLHQTDTDLKTIANETLLKLRSKIAVQRIQSISFFTLGMIAIGVLILVIFFMYRRAKKQTHRFNYVMQQLRKGESVDTINQITASKKKQTLQPKEILSVENLISEETETRILSALTAMEKKNSFALDPNVTLTKLASDIETNTKYLTFVIGKHRGKNFNNYINDLRINYILKKLQEDPKFLQYKIRYIAEVAGFSSHSKFTSEFKRVVGITPSVFISKLGK